MGTRTSRHGDEAKVNRIEESGSARADGTVTRELAALQDGDRAAFERLLPLVYAELHGVAERALAREHVGHTLQATELVHEAFFKLAGAAPAAHDRAHFLGLAARVMRQVLVEHARRRLADKRGGGLPFVTLGDAVAAVAVRDEELIALDDALRRLDELSPRLRTVVECRFFAGMSEREVADALGVTERTVQRDWVKARAWLHATLAGVQQH